MLPGQATPSLDGSTGQVAMGDLHSRQKGMSLRCGYIDCLSSLSFKPCSTQAHSQQICVGAYMTDSALVLHTDSVKHLLTKEGSSTATGKACFPLFINIKIACLRSAARNSLATNTEMTPDSFEMEEHRICNIRSVFLSNKSIMFCFQILMY